MLAEGIEDDGSYPWDITATFEDADISLDTIDAKDYSIMMSTEEGGIKSAISGFFTLKKKKSDSDKDTSGSGGSTELAQVSDAAGKQQCLDYLKAHGGYYNQTEDRGFRRGNSFTSTYESDGTSWTISNSGAGSSTILIQGKDDTGGDANAEFPGADLDMITQTSVGMGTISLTSLQLGRKASVTDMNVVSLNLGTDDHAGSIVFGGYDENLIDVDQSAIFTKQPDDTKGSFRVYLESIKVKDKAAVTYAEHLEIALAYDSNGLRLPQDTIDKLLPTIGDPKFDEDVNGYIYSGSAPSDSTISFTLHNGTTPVLVEMPLSALMFTETEEDNPLTARKENGITYLRLQPTGEGAGAYLGRSFLRHIYLVNSPAKIQKFHINAIPSDLSKDKSLVAASPASNAIFQGVLNISSSSSSPQVGPMVGGIVGGLAVLLIAGSLWWWVIKRRRRQQSEDSAYHFSDRDADPQFSYQHFDKEGTGYIAGAAPMSPGYGPMSPMSPMSAGFSADNRSTIRSALSKNTSVRTTHTIPISYSPSPFEKELGTRFSSILPPSRIRSQPVFELPPAAAHRHHSHRSQQSQQSHHSHHSHHTHHSPSPDGTAQRYSHISALSAANQRRQNHSPVSAGYASSASSHMHELHADDRRTPTPLQRTATLARIVPAESILRPSSSSPDPSSMRPTHARTASRGRILTPALVELEGGVVRPPATASSSSSSSAASSRQAGTVKTLDNVTEEDERSQRKMEKSKGRDTWTSALTVEQRASKYHERSYSESTDEGEEAFGLRAAARSPDGNYLTPTEERSFIGEVHGEAGPSRPVQRHIGELKKDEA